MPIQIFLLIFLGAFLVVFGPAALFVAPQVPGFWGRRPARTPSFRTRPSYRTAEPSWA